jgi:hypothetical protein
MPDRKQEIPLHTSKTYGALFDGIGLTVGYPNGNLGHVYVGGQALSLSTVSQLLFDLHQYVRAQIGVGSSMVGN